MYYYNDNGTINKKIGGTPPLTNDYVAIDPSGIVRHVVNNSVIQEEGIGSPQIKEGTDPIDSIKLKVLYTNGTGYKIARKMLSSPQRKNKISKAKIKAKTKTKSKHKVKGSKSK